MSPLPWPPFRFTQWRFPFFPSYRRWAYKLQLARHTNDRLINMNPRPDYAWAWDAFNFFYPSTLFYLLTV